MENTVNSRILLLKSELGFTTMDFCSKAKISSGTFQNIRINENVNQRTLNLIIENLNVNRDWLMHGKGKMFNEAKHTAVGMGAENPYKDALVAELKSQVEYLKEMLKMAIAGKNPNFLKALEKAHNIKLFPNLEQLNIVSGANVSGRA